jgi:hypothetical protein
MATDRTVCRVDQFAEAMAPGFTSQTPSKYRANGMCRWPST